MHRRLIALLGTALVASASTAFAQHPAAGGTGMGDLSPSTAVHGDGEVAAVLATLDRGEVALGGYAETHAVSNDVRRFARMLVAMHTAATARVTALLRRVRVEPAEDGESRRLAEEGTATQHRLSSLTGTEYDRAYVDAQVAIHTHALDLIDHALLPAARSPEMRMALQNEVRPMVAAHLAQARALRERL